MYLILYLVFLYFYLTTLNHILFKLITSHCTLYYYNFIFNFCFFQTSSTLQDTKMMNSELQSKKCNSINAKVAELNVISSETESDTSQSTMVCCLLSKMKNELHNFNIDTSSILCLISIHSTYLIINLKKYHPLLFMAIYKVVQFYLFQWIVILKYGKGYSNTIIMWGMMKACVRGKTGGVYKWQKKW